MPETAAIGDAYEVRIVGRMEGQETDNVMHFVAAQADPDVLTHLILVLAQCFITNLLPVLSSAWTFEKIVWKKVTPVLGVEHTTIPNGAGPGGGSADALPSYSSVVFSKRTLLGGKSHRGRMYVPGIPENATNVSSLATDNAFWQGALAFAVCVLQNFHVGDPPGPATWSFAVYSRKIGGAHVPYGANGFTAVETFTPDVLLGTTRSRKVGRGA